MYESRDQVILFILIFIFVCIVSSIRIVLGYTREISDSFHLLFCYFDWRDNDAETREAIADYNRALVLSYVLMIYNNDRYRKDARRSHVRYKKYIDEQLATLIRISDKHCNESISDKKRVNLYETYNEWIEKATAKVSPNWSTQLWRG